MRKWFKPKSNPSIRSTEKKHLLRHFSAQTSFLAPDLGDWYPPVLIGPSTIGSKATDTSCLQEAIQIIRQLEPDDYVKYLLSYYRTGLERFGSNWKYADIITVLLATAQLIQPQDYLEIGVRRGRSMAMIASTCPQCSIIGFDMWVSDYARMPNPGPEFVQVEMSKLGYSGNIILVSGDSHKTVPDYLDQNPNQFFDLITVDGDHSEQGARKDLNNVIPRLKVGGVLVFDDICHPKHPYLADVWQSTVAHNPLFCTWEFTELGYGVGFAVRKEI
jgi:predicted O-methyltransferase YrrM